MLQCDNWGNFLKCFSQSRQLSKNHKSSSKHVQSCLHEFSMTSFFYFIPSNFHQILQEKKTISSKFNFYFANVSKLALLLLLCFNAYCCNCNRGPKHCSFCYSALAESARLKLLPYNSSTSLTHHYKIASCQDNV